MVILRPTLQMGFPELQLQTTLEGGFVLRV